ncbi:MAG: recombinase RecT [Fibromonadaceae bacterium]|jgi:recombination protein RecT|nr:recombinase RecT [Fibromonadaceae bacterium]
MEKVQEPTALATADPIKNFQIKLDGLDGEIKAVLPSNITLAAFKRVVRTAVQNDLELLAANPKTLYTACLECAKQGLLPDGEEAALVIFGGKNGKTVSFMPMVKGVIKQIWRSGKIGYISANAVYENDTFDYCLGDEEYIKHRPTMENRGKIIAAYAIVKTKEGEFIRTVLTKQDIEKLRESGKSPNGDYWTKWYDQMAIKSAIHRLAKKLDLSVEYEVVEDLKEIPYSPPKLIPPQTQQALPKSKAIEAETNEPLISAAPPVENEAKEPEATPQEEKKEDKPKKVNGKGKEPF